MLRNQKPLKRNSTTATNSGKRLKKVKTEHHKPKYKNSIFEQD